MTSRVYILNLITRIFFWLVCAEMGFNYDNVKQAHQKYCMGEDFSVFRVANLVVSTCYVKKSYQYTVYSDICFRRHLVAMFSRKYLDENYMHVNQLIGSHVVSIFSHSGTTIEFIQPLLCSLVLTHLLKFLVCTPIFEAICAINGAHYLEYSTEQMNVLSLHMSYRYNVFMINPFGVENLDNEFRYKFFQVVTVLIHKFFVQEQPTQPLFEITPEMIKSAIKIAVPIKTTNQYEKIMEFLGKALRWEGFMHKNLKDGVIKLTATQLSRVDPLKQVILNTVVDPDLLALLVEPKGLQSFDYEPDTQIDRLKRTHAYIDVLRGIFAGFSDNRDLKDRDDWKIIWEYIITALVDVVILKPLTDHPAEIAVTSFFKLLRFAIIECDLSYFRDFINENDSLSTWIKRNELSNKKWIVTDLRKILNSTPKKEFVPVKPSDVRLSTLF